MANFELKYPDIPQIIKDGNRMKGVYDTAGTFIWPFDEEQGGDSPEVVPGGYKGILVDRPLDQLAEGDIVMLVAFNGEYIQMAASQGTSSAPMLDSFVAVEDGRVILAENIYTEYVDKIFCYFCSYDEYGNFALYLLNEKGQVTEKFLYCNNTNNGVRVGEHSENYLFTYDSEGSPDNGIWPPYLIKNVATGRYLYPYNNQNIRTVTSPANNNIQRNDWGLWILKIVPEDGIISGGNHEDYKPRTRKFPVTFNPNGGNSLAQAFSITDIKGTKIYSDWEWTEYGKFLQTPPTPTRSGYTFKYWSYDTNGNRRWYSSDSISNDITLYAIWESNGGGTDPDVPDPTPDPEPDIPEVDGYLVVSNLAEYFNYIADGRGFLIGKENGVDNCTVASSPYERMLVIKDNITEDAIVVYDQNRVIANLDKGWFMGNIWFGLKGVVENYKGWEFIPTECDFIEHSDPITNLGPFSGLDVDSVFGDGDQYGYLNFGSIQYNIMDGWSKNCAQPLVLWAPYPADEDGNPLPWLEYNADHEYLVVHLGGNNEKIIVLPGIGMRLNEVASHIGTLEPLTGGLIFEGYLVRSIGAPGVNICEMIANHVHIYQYPHDGGDIPEIEEILSWENE